MARTTTSRARSPDLEARWAVIRRKLEAHAEVLASRGSLVAKQARGRRVWAVRFVVAQGGRTIHRSIFIGGDELPELLERTRSLLEGYRLPRRWAEDVQGYARLAARAGTLVRRLAAGRGRPG
jgi:hypothetical protein